jgi:hypothetical protein
MIISANANLNLWSAAIDTANYLRNRSPSSALNGMTPYEALYKKKPKINHLVIFGSDAYPLEMTNKRDKFEPTARSNCIMIGYGNKEGIYWVFDKTNQKAFRSRDVKFNEESILNNTNEENIDLGNLIEKFIDENENEEIDDEGGNEDEEKDDENRNEDEEKDDENKNEEEGKEDENGKEDVEKDDEDENTRKELIKNREDVINNLQK